MTMRFPILPALLASFGVFSILPSTSVASADAMSPGAPLLAQVASADQLRVVKTHKLFRTEARPYAVVPEGAAIWVRAPAGTTTADLYHRLSSCEKLADESSTPLCVPGARISVDRDHGHYRVTVKADSRSAALEIQRRADALL